MTTKAKPRTFRQPPPDTSRFEMPLVFPDRGTFFCDACLVEHPIDDASRQDRRYCQWAFDVMTSQATPPQEVADYWTKTGVFVHYGRVYTATKRGRTVCIGEVGPAPDRRFTTPQGHCSAKKSVTESKNAPKVGVSLDVTALVKELKGQGYSLRATSRELARRGVSVSYVGVKRILDGQGVLV